MNRLLTDARKLLVYHPAILVVALMISLIGGLQLVRSQNPQETKEGKTRPTLLVPGQTIDAGEVIFTPDTDHDGMPDEDEGRNGTNPDDASDADEDADNDGLTNGDEVAGGSDVNSADSDNDGVSDGEEVGLGYNPLDPGNTPPPGAAIASLQIAPNPINISVNAFFGQDPLQLRVTAVRTDSTTFDLTGSHTLTYQSLDESIAFVDAGGNAFGFNSGSTTIRVSIGTVTADVPLLVTTLTPGPVGMVDIPGYANNVDVAGNYAYVAAGSAGLVIVDITDRSAPAIVATLDTPGNANDVRLVGTKAYVADGSEGLAIIDVTTPSTPVVLGSLDTPGDSYDVVVYGPLAYVADGPSGVQIINVSSPATPVFVGSADTPGLAKGVDVSGDMIVVADDAPAAVVIIDAAIPASPQIAGSVSLSDNALDLEVRNRFAYVAAFTGGMQVIDFSIPANPRIVAGIQNFFYPRDIALGQKYAVAADVVFFNAVPIIDIKDPSGPFYAGALDFSSLGDFDGTGIAVDPEYIYMTGAAGDAFNTENGQSGDSRLFIGRYLQAEEPVSDTAGVAPTVNIDSPQSGQSTIEGDRLPISIIAKDDVKVALVQLIVNGVVVISDVAPPYDITYSVPRGLTSLTIEAKAFDVAGNAATSPPVTISVLPDPPPTVTITYPAVGQVLIEGQIITLIAQATDNSSVQQVVFNVNGETLSNFSAFVVPTGISSLTFEAIATDDLGHTASTTLTLSVIPDPPPTIVITNPSEGQVLYEEQDLYLDAYATDNVSIQSVVFSVNGTPLDSPLFRVPTGVTSITITATATDNLGQSTSATRTSSVVPDPPPTISFTNPAEGQQLFEEQDLYLEVEVNDNGGIQSVVFSVDGVPLDGSYYRVPTGVTSLTFAATATDDRDQTGSTTRTVAVVPDPPPTINIVAPAEGTQYTEGQTAEFVAEANDNLSVASVEFSVNGALIATDYDAPYTQSYMIPIGTTSLLLEAAAIDNLGQRTVAARTFTVVPDPGTTVTGQVVDTSAQPVEGATVTVFDTFTTQTGADGNFSIEHVPTVRGDVLARVTATIAGKATANASLLTAPVSGGTTNLGVITLSVAPTAPSAFAMADFDRDFNLDVFVGYPDRQSLIYSFNNGAFTPNTSLLLPYGAVTSGANLSLNFESQQQIFAQLPGRPGKVLDVSFDNGTMQSPRTLTTGLAGESEFTAVGLDTPQGQTDSPSRGQSMKGSNSVMSLALVGSNRTVLAFLKNGAGATSLSVRFGDDSAEGFGEPQALPVDSSAPLRSLALTDVNNDGLLDVLVVKPVTGDVGKLLVYLRTSASTFGNAIETSITVRTTAPASGAVDFVVGRFAGNSNQDVAVLGDDRVRIYTGNGTGAFASSGEVALPAGKIGTGITTYDLRRDGRSDLMVTTSDTTTATDKQLLVYRNTSGDVFLSPTITTYIAPVSGGDTRIGVGEWGGGFRNLDMVVLDGDTIKLFIDCGGSGSGS